MDAFGGLREDERDDEDETPALDPRDRAAIDSDDHEGLLRLLTAENAEAAIELFYEAKNPNIDPVLNNARKGIATCTASFGKRG